MRKLLTLLVAGLLWSSTAAADTFWVRENDLRQLNLSDPANATADNNTLVAQTSIAAGQTLVLEFEDDDNGSTVFSTRQIEAGACTLGLLIEYDCDILDATSPCASAGEVAMWSTTTKAADADQGTQAEMAKSGRRILADIDGGGVDDLTLNGDDGTNSQQRTYIWHPFPVRWFWAQVTVLPASSDIARVKVTCYNRLGT